MSFLFGSAKTPDVPVLPAAPADTGVQDAANAMAESLRKRKGFLSTIVTGPEGITGATSTEKATLLSGAGGYG